MIHSRHTHHKRLTLLLAAIVITIIVSFAILLAPRTALAASSQVNQALPGTFYSFVLDPNVVFLLFIVAMVGIFLEIAHPGAIVPGAIGSIALILFLIAIASLSFNWVGLVLMFLAFALLVIDLRASTHGLLTLGSVASLIGGALLLFSGPGVPDVDPTVVYVMGGFVGVLGVGLINVIARSQHKPITTGPEGMIGKRALVLTPLHPEGRVRYDGEDWAAVLDDPASSVDVNSEVQITGVEGLRLHVRSVRGQEMVQMQSEAPHSFGADE